MPTRDEGNGNALALASSRLHSAIPRSAALDCAHNAAQPATCGVAMLVPLFVPYRVGRGTEEKTSRPGAAISTLPKFENDDGLSGGSSEATDMIVGELAGAPVLEAAFPDAATIRQPRPSAAIPAAVYAACTGDWEPSDIEMTWHRLAIAQFMPASTLAELPDPVLLSTFPTKIWAR